MSRAACMVALAAVLALSGGGCAAPHYDGYKYRPYTLRGVRYHPMHPVRAPGFVETGTASHYSGGFLFFPGKTAIGERLYPWSRGAAHKTLPLPCFVEVTNLENGRRVRVRVNDRGPFVRGRILDVTRPVADELGFTRQGLARVRVEVLSVGDGRHRIR